MSNVRVIVYPEAGRYPQRRWFGSVDAQGAAANIYATASWTDTMPAATIFICDVARSILTISMILDEAAGSAATIAIYKNPTYDDTGAITGGTVVHTGTFNANGPTGIIQQLAVTVPNLNVGDWLGVAPVGNFTDSTGNITIALQ